MDEYGLTSQGVNIKRLDEILDEMHDDLSEEWGINTRQNPESLLNVLLTNIADSLAELWEMGLDVYNSQYPASAEGMYLDNVAQFAGVSRETDAPSYYHILCIGEDGTEIPSDTVLASNTSPVTNFVLTKAVEITRESFNKAKVKIVSNDGNPMTIILDGDPYSVTPQEEETDEEILERLAKAITDTNFTVSVKEDVLSIESVSETASSNLILSDNLTTESVGSVITFATEDYGDIYLPNGAVTVITKAVTGLSSVVNVGSYIAGQLEQTDTEYRASYLDRIYARSSRMVDSIASAILDNVQGVSAVAVYENDTDEVDEYDRYPHSVEVVCDGGDDLEIAEQILNTKAAGINTFGSVEVTVPCNYNNEINIRFNRPTYLYLWVQCTISPLKDVTLSSDYADAIREIIIKRVEDLICGENVIPQDIFLPDIYSDVYGVGYVDILMEIGNEKPEEYTQRNIYASARERIVTDIDKIEVVVNG